MRSQQLNCLLQDAMKQLHHVKNASMLQQKLLVVQPCKQTTPAQTMTDVKKTQKHILRLAVAATFGCDTRALKKHSSTGWSLCWQHMNHKADQPVIPLLQHVAIQLQPQSNRC